MVLTTNMTSVFKLLIIGFFVAYLFETTYGAATNKFFPSRTNARESNNVCYGDRFSSIEEHPYLVGIYTMGSYFCAGAIVSPSWVVTGGSCVADYALGNLSVLAGSDYLNQYSGTFYSVRQVVAHPNYTEFSYDYQYACVEIEGAFGWSSTIQPITLPDHSATAGSILTVSGWTHGFEVQNTEKGVPNAFVQEGLMEWLSKDVCNATFFSSNITWTDTMGCAYNKTNTIFCATGWYYPFTKDGLLYGQYLQELYPKGRKHKESNLFSIVSDIATVTPWIRVITGAP